MPSKIEPKKMSQEEFFEVIVGKTAGMEKEINKKIDEYSEYLLKELEKYAVDKNLAAPQLVLYKPQIDEKAENTTKTEPIEYEQVNVRIPKAVMDLLRHQSITGDTPEQDIEWCFVESVRSRIDGGVFLPTPKALADQYNLNPVFEAVLNDSIKNSCLFLFSFSLCFSAGLIVEQSGSGSPT